jgi:hypothetical protein
MAEVERLHLAPVAAAEAECASRHLERQNGSDNHGEGHDRVVPAMFRRPGAPRSAGPTHTAHAWHRGGAALTSDRIGRVGGQRGNRSAATVVAHVALDAIVGGFASIADRPQTAGRPSDPTCLRTLMLSVGSGRSAGCAAG